MVKKIGTITVFTLALALFALPLQAEEITLDVDSSVELALKNNLSLQSSRIDLTTVERNKNTAWNELMPSLSVGASLSHTKDYSSSQSSSAGQDNSPWGLSLSITTSLPLSASIPFSIRDAVLQYESGIISFEEAEQKIERDVKKSFYYLLLTQEETKIVESSIKTAQTDYDITKQNYEKGLVSELDMLSAEVQLETTKPKLEDVRVAYGTTIMEFKQILGLDQDADIILNGSIDTKEIPLDVDGSIQDCISTRTDVQDLVKEIQILENQKRLITAEEFTPDLSLSYSYSGALSDPFGTQWGDIDNWARQGSLRLSLTVPMDPLFPASSSRIKLAGTDDSLQKASIELAETRQLAEIEIKTLVMSLEKSLSVMDSLEKNVTLAQKVYELREAEYEAGLTELLEAQEAFDDLQEAKLEVLTEKYNYLTTLLDLEYAINIDLDY